MTGRPDRAPAKAELLRERGDAAERTELRRFWPEGAAEARGGEKEE